MKFFSTLFLGLTLMMMSAGQLSAQAPANSNVDVKLEGTVLFLGDSITHSGHYISYIESVTKGNVTLLNLGLPSETVTGFSEPAHPFPRPNVHDRLDNALAKSNPDVVFACYGMNDGIYHPFSEERFAAYRQGINTLIEKVTASGAKLILMTPPPFDPAPLKTKGKLRPADADAFSWTAIYEHYDRDVIAQYAEWVLKQKDRVAGVIDLHTPVTAYTAEKRKEDPNFTLSNDGVHLNVEGHKILATTILAALGEDAAAVENIDADEFAVIGKRQQILHNAWLSHVGHTRPGVKAGLPLKSAQAMAALIGNEAPTILFNGSNLKGWDGDPKIWSVENGEILGRNTTSVPSSTYLFTEKDYREFRLIFEVKQTVAPGYSTMHSAVAALGERFTDKGENKHGFKGPLLMFCHDWGIWDAYRRNRIEPAAHRGTLRIDGEKVGDWNFCEILVKGNRIRFAANGVEVFDFTDKPEMLKKSPLGLQIHSNGKPQEYRWRGLVISENPGDALVTLKP